MFRRRLSSARAPEKGGWRNLPFFSPHSCHTGRRLMWLYRGFFHIRSSSATVTRKTIVCDALDKQHFPLSLIPTVCCVADDDRLSILERVLSIEHFFMVCSSVPHHVKPLQGQRFHMYVNGLLVNTLPLVFLVLNQLTTTFSRNEESAQLK